MYTYTLLGVVVNTYVHIPVGAEAVRICGVGEGQGEAPGE